ncbi:DUF423 domain-containing protein [Flagellimonas sp. 2504JD4-2]
MNKTILMTATLFGLTAIILGAFGAHGLEKVVDQDAIESFETGVRYQMYHALFLLFLGMWNGITERQKRRVYQMVFIGTVLFSFSIYLLALKSLMSIDFNAIAYLTPIGGVLLILGWGFTAYYILASRKV